MEKLNEDKKEQHIVHKGRFTFDTRISKVYKDKSGNMHVLAVASDSLVDYDDDRMSYKCLEGMAKQLKMNPLPLLDSHSSTFGYGMSHDAYVVESSEGIYDLFVDFKLKSHYPQSIELYESVASEECKYQLSIGGLINKSNPYAVRFETDKSTGKLVRVVEDVVLDHVASTRPDNAANGRTKFVSSIVKSAKWIKDEALYKSWCGEGKDSHDNTSRDIGDVKNVIPFQKHNLAENDAEWTFSGNDIKEILDIGGWPLVKSAFARYDNSKGDIPEDESVYEYPHHKMVKGRFVTVRNGVISAMYFMCGDLSEDISSCERSEMIKHLSEHFREFNLTAPSEEELDDMTTESYLEFIKKQGIDTKFLEDLMPKENKKEEAVGQGADASTEKTEVSKSSDVSLLESFDGFIAQIRKGFTADQLTGDIAQRMKSMQQVLTELLSQKEGVTLKSAETQETASGMSLTEDIVNQIVERVVTKVSEVNGNAVSVITEKMMSGKDNGLEKSVDTLKETVRNNNEVLKSEFNTIESRLQKLEKTAGVSQSVPVSSNVQPEGPKRVEKSTSENWGTGIFMNAAKQALSKID